MKTVLHEEGRSYIDLSEGTPDTQPPGVLIEHLSQRVTNSHAHGYPTRSGIPALRTEILNFLRNEFGVTDRTCDVLPAAGSKELIAHFCQALLDPGDVLLIPEIHYPMYPVAGSYAGAEVAVYPFTDARSAVPNLQAVPRRLFARARALILNYPHNPTGAVLPVETLHEVVSYCRDHNVTVCMDMAYSHITYSQSAAPSALTAGNSCYGVVELHSLSKNLSIPGWRAAFASGDPRLIALLEQAKAVFDTGQFIPIQQAIAYGLRNFHLLSAAIRRTYSERLDLALLLLQDAKIECARPLGTFYLWCRLPAGLSASRFCIKLLSEKSVLVMPGSAFGDQQDTYFRISLTQPADVLQLALTAVREFSREWSG